MIKYIEALQKYSDRDRTILCYHRWDKETGICLKCSHINTDILMEKKNNGK